MLVGNSDGSDRKVDTTAMTGEIVGDIAGEGVI